MGNKQPRAEPGTVDPDRAVSPPLDQSRMQTERRAATGRLLARLKTLEGTPAVETPRAYARRYVREQESLILGLLNAGVGTEEILTDLTVSFPSIPTADFRHAVAQLRDRRRKGIGVTPTTTVGRPASTPPPGSSGNAPPRPAEPTPSVPDRRPDESEEDYRLRKALEGPPDQPRQFIGEH